MVPTENKAKRYSSVNHTTKTIHHNHHHTILFPLSSRHAFSFTHSVRCLRLENYGFSKIFLCGQLNQLKNTKCNALDCAEFRNQVHYRKRTWPIHQIPFMTHFMRIFDTAKASLVSLKNDELADSSDILYVGNGVVMIRLSLTIWPIFSSFLILHYYSLA